MTRAKITSGTQADSILGRSVVGGLYGINVETLGANKTLTPGTDKIYQYLDEGGANRIITLATAGAQAGDRFVIKHNGSYNDIRYLEVKQGGTSLNKIYALTIAGFVFDGTNWIDERTGSGHASTYHNIAIGKEASGYSSGVAVGYLTKGYTNGVAVGYQASGYSSGVAVGYQASGYTYGVAIGAEAIGYLYGVAIGYKASTNTKYYSIALGYYSKCVRYGETSINIDDSSLQKNNAVQGRWAGTTANATPVEIFCAARANERFTIRASSVLAFRMTIVARDNVANEVAMYTIDDGLIKRDAAGNTTMVNCTVVIVYEDDAGWDVAVSADDGNDALIITVTGDGANPVQWVAVMDGVETHF